MSSSIGLLFSDIMNNNLKASETKISGRKRDYFIGNNTFSLIEKNTIVSTKLESKVLIVKKLIYYLVFLTGL